MLVPQLSNEYWEKDNKFGFTMLVPVHRVVKLSKFQNVGLMTSLYDYSILPSPLLSLIINLY